MALVRVEAMDVHVMRQSTKDFRGEAKVFNRFIRGRARWNGFNVTDV
jgi:hypothetical protein